MALNKFSSLILQLIITSNSIHNIFVIFYRQKKKASQSKPQGPKGKWRHVPFHQRRNHGLEMALQHDVDSMMQNLPAKAVGLKPPLGQMSASQQQQQQQQPMSSSSTSSTSTSSTSTTPGTSTTTTTTSSDQQQTSAMSGVKSLDSPLSAAPSPLIAPLIQPGASATTTLNGDHATMPTLSPHPPLVKQEPGSKDSAAPASANTDNNTSTTAAPAENESDKQQAQQQAQKPAVDLKFRTAATPAHVVVTPEQPNTWYRPPKAFKRPHLSVNEFDECPDDESKFPTIYNFKQLNAW